MAQIDYDKVKLIVENNLRDAGFKGTNENGWKQSISVNGATYTLDFNLQTLRDVMAKSIVDVLTNTTANGTTSIGNTQGSPQISTDTSIINITKDQNSPSYPAARVGDYTTITMLSDPKFMVWVQTISGAVSALTGGGIPQIVQISGVVTTGSQTVEIGD